jgi:excisionase family DNA binding protein
MLSVNDVSSRLGVSPRRVRQLLESCELRGDRLGRQWVIQEADLRRFDARSYPRGRRWEPESAWLALAEASNIHISSSAHQRSRVRKRLRDESILGVYPCLGSRAVNLRYYAHPSVIERMKGDDRLVLGGVSAASVAGADLMPNSDEFEAYVSSFEEAAIVQRYALDAEAARPNVLLRVVADDLWPFLEGVKSAPRLVVAVDLLDHEDERVRRAGMELAEAG